MEYEKSYDRFEKTSGTNLLNLVLFVDSFTNGADYFRQGIHSTIAVKGKLKEGMKCKKIN